MNLNNINTVYFIGIGGIGMSALARHFLTRGKRIMGYDRVLSQVTQELEKAGVEIYPEGKSRSLEHLIKSDTLVVYTPAIPNDHEDLAYFRKNGFHILKRSEVLGMITRDSFCLAVSGTHGKTTVTAILAHLLLCADVKMTAFLGGISENYQSNYISNGFEVTVVEADEYDRSFMRLYPDVICITSMDADHLDIYGDDATLKKVFSNFADKVSDKKRVLIPKGLPLRGETFGIEDKSDYEICNISRSDDVFVFDINTPKGCFENVKFPGFGLHNLVNALTAFAMALQTNAAPKDLIDALGSFKGIKRRFSYEIRRKDFVFIDDYAHHPIEIDAIHDAVRDHHPNSKVMAIFQPHLYSRTRDFAKDFAKSLSGFDNVVLLDIYPAREKPIEGVNSKWLLEMISSDDKCLIKKSQIVECIQKHSPDVLLTIGAGDISEEVETIKKALET